MTPEARARLDALLKRTGESMADWIERHVDEEMQKNNTR
jgi:predicted DNA-binding protein